MIVPNSLSPKQWSRDLVSFLSLALLSLTHGLQVHCTKYIEASKGEREWRRLLFLNFSNGICRIGRHMAPPGGLGMRNVVPDGAACTVCGWEAWIVVESLLTPE